MERPPHHDEVRPPDALLACEMRQQADGLKRLAEAHFIGEDAVEAALVDGDQPLQPHMLVFPQLRLDQEGDWHLRRRHNSTDSSNPALGTTTDVMAVWQRCINRSQQLWMQDCRKPICCILPSPLDISQPLRELTLKMSRETGDELCA